MRLFCTECGELMEVKRGYLLLYGYGRCRKCAKLPLPRRLLASLLCIMSAFYLGSLTAAPCKRGVTASSQAIIKTPVRARVEKECGAKTRSGRACRRRVKGEGYCWQHKNVERGG